MEGDFVTKGLCAAPKGVQVETPDLTSVCDHAVQSDVPASQGAAAATQAQGKPSEEEAKQSHLASKARIDFVAFAAAKKKAKATLIEKEKQILEEELRRLQKENCSLRVAAAEAADKEQILKEQVASRSAAAYAAQTALSEARKATEKAQQKTLRAQELVKVAEDKWKQAEAQRIREARAEAEQAHSATRQSELWAKAELICQSQEAQRLSETCAVLAYEKEEIHQKFLEKVVSQEQAEQALVAKHAELQVQHQAVQTLQEMLQEVLRGEHSRASASAQAPSCSAPLQYEWTDGVPGVTPPPPIIPGWEEYVLACCNQSLPALATNPP